MMPLTFTKAKPKPMSMVARRRKLDIARRKGEAIVASRVLDMFSRQFKWLKRDLRRQNLRKRLAKADDPLGDASVWNDWEDAFMSELATALTDGSKYVGQVESDFFTSHGFAVYEFDYSEIVKSYEATTGRKIKDITEETRSKVAKDINDWFGTDKGLPELITTLGKYFDESRARLIAATEMAYIASEVANAQMQHYGIEQWFWDAILDYATCPTCADLHGQLFKSSDPKPPDITHPNCRCGILYDIQGFVPEPIGVDQTAE